MHPEVTEAVDVNAFKPQSAQDRGMVRQSKAHLHAAVKRQPCEDDGSPGLRPICIYLLEPLVHLQPTDIIVAFCHLAFQIAVILVYMQSAVPAVCI